MKAEDETFATSYDKLIEAMSELFFDNWNSIKKGKIVAAKQTGEGTYHTSKELAEIRRKTDFSWDENIARILDRIQNDRN